MKLNKLGKFAALCMAGCMLLGGCGAENPADEKTVTGNAADVSAEKSETGMDSENNTTEKNDMAAEDTAAETESAETETEDSGVAIPEVVIEPKEIPDTDGMKFVRDMKIGWNLGNTFDAITNAQKEDELSIEWSWCGEKTTKEMIDAVKAAGFKTLRLPVSWHNHVSGDHYTISEAWLDRVQEVLDYAVDDDMYVILNIHHDTDKEYCYPDKEHLEQSLSYMTSIWEQLADRFGDYDEHVIFESINEPRLVETDHEWWLDMNAAECVEAVECINEWNQNFVDVVRKTGGNNATRYLMVSGYDASADGVLNDKFVLPTDTAENEGKILVSVHAYIPYHFALQAATENESIDQFDASGKTSTNDIDQMMEKLYAKYISNEIPVVIGEFGARDKNGNLQSRVDYAAYYIAAARAYGMSCNWWDNNAFTGDGELFGLLDRKTVTWRYQEIVDALMKYAE